MALFTGVQHLCTFGIVAPLIYYHLSNVWKPSYTIIASIFVDVPYWQPYIMNKFISCALPGSSQWFFHFGEMIVIAWTQEKTTTVGGTEPHHSSWQCKESRYCCHGPLVLLAMGDSGTSTVLTRYESMWLRSLHQSERTTAERTWYNTRDELMRAIGQSVWNSNKDGGADGVRCLPDIWKKGAIFYPVNKTMSEMSNSFHYFSSNPSMKALTVI